MPPRDPEEVSIDRPENGHWVEHHYADCRGCNNMRARMMFLRRAMRKLRDPSEES
jgi:hypothetical protein